MLRMMRASSTDLEVGKGEGVVGEELDGEGHDGGGGLVAGDQECQQEVHRLLLREAFLALYQSGQHVLLPSVRSPIF